MAVSIRNYIIHTSLPSQANPHAFAQIQFFMEEHPAPNSDRQTTADILNSIAARHAADFSYRFVDQESMQDGRYYEEIIFQDHVIPTRNGSWHDYFNGLMWFQYPKTKGYLNALHWEDIQLYGQKHRTPRRDRATHWDECGIVLLTDQPSLAQNLAAHDWQGVFCTNHGSWFTRIIPLHFGHANLEMLCQPFIGLTAKAFVLNDAELIEQLSQVAHNDMFTQSLSMRIDEVLCEQLVQQKVFDERGRLKPLPILGIPTWHNEQQDEQFYANTDYFMPKRKRV